MDEKCGKSTSTLGCATTLHYNESQYLKKRSGPQLHKFSPLDNPYMYLMKAYPWASYFWVRAREISKKHCARVVLI
jgi:hypothetical protein